MKPLPNKIGFARLAHLALLLGAVCTVAQACGGGGVVPSSAPPAPRTLSDAAAALLARARAHEATGALDFALQASVASYRAQPSEAAKEVFLRVGREMRTWVGAEHILDAVTAPVVDDPALGGALSQIRAELSPRATPSTEKDHSVEVRRALAAGAPRRALDLLSKGNVASPVREDLTGRAHAALGDARAAGLAFARARTWVDGHARELSLTPPALRQHGGGVFRDGADLVLVRQDWVERWDIASTPHRLWRTRVPTFGAMVRGAVVAPGAGDVFANVGGRTLRLDAATGAFVGMLNSSADVVFPSGGAMLLSVGFSVRFIDAATGGYRHPTLQGAPNVIGSRKATASDHSAAVVCWDDGRVSLIDLVTGKTRGSLSHGNQRCESAAFSKGDRFVGVSWSRPRHVVVLDGRSGRIVFEQQDDHRAVRPILSGDEGRVVVYDLDGRASLKDLSSGRNLWRGSPARRAQAELGPYLTSGLLIVPYANGEVDFVDPESGVQLWSLADPQLEGALWLLAKYDGRRFLAVPKNTARGKQLVVLDVGQRRSVLEVDGVRAGAAFPILRADSPSILFHPTKEQAVVPLGSKSQPVLGFYDLGNATELRSFPGLVPGTGYTDDGQRFVAKGPTGSPVELRSDDLKIVSRPQQPVELRRLRGSASGRALAYHGRDLYVLDGPTATVIGPRVLDASFVAASPVGGHAIIASAALGPVVTLDLASGRVRELARLDKVPAVAVAVSGDGRMGAVADAGGDVTIYEPGGERTRRVNAGTSPTSIALDRTGQLLVVGAGDAGVRVFDIGEATHRLLFEDKTVRAEHVAVSAELDSVVASSPKQLTIWSMKGQRKGTLEQGGRVIASPDGRHMAVDHRRTVDLLDLETGNLRGLKHSSVASGFDDQAHLLTSRLEVLVPGEPPGPARVADDWAFGPIKNNDSSSFLAPVRGADQELFPLSRGDVFLWKDRGVLYVRKADGGTSTGEDSSDVLASLVLHEEGWFAVGRSGAVDGSEGSEELLWTTWQDPNHPLPKTPQLEHDPVELPLSGAVGWPRFHQPALLEQALRGKVAPPPWPR